jgi:parallel beta-helix repeat protein
MKKAVTIFTLFLLLSAIFIAPVQAESEIVDPLSESLETPGRVVDSGTYFEITNSKYLDISIESTAEIKLTLESVPHVVTMVIESVTDAASTQLTLGGLLPATTYYKYEDDFHNLAVFTTDGAGTHIFIQDLTKSHIIFIQPTPSTYFIRDDDTGGDCACDDANGGDCEKEPIGTWDAENKTCTLITNVNQTIQIDSDGITLDGAGFSITPSQGSSGIYLSKRKDVTIKNVTIEQFSYGIYLFKSDGNTLSDNDITAYDSGIYLACSKNNKLTGNTLSGNYRGIYLDGKSDDNVLDANFANENTYGIYLSKSSNNVITGNSVSRNINTGIYLTGSGDNTLTDNTADANTGNGTGYGIYLISYSDKNTLTGNTISNNSNTGLILAFCSNNVIYNNNFIDNDIQAGIYSGADNIFNMAAPGGGNYWNDYDEPEEGCIDDDDNGFCDDPYDIFAIFGGNLAAEDGSPWTVQNGWRDSDGDGIPDDEDDCPNASGPADQFGCPFADETYVSMRIVDFQGSGVCGHNKKGRAKRSSIVDLDDVMVRIYDREDEKFLEAYGRWPSRRRLDEIFQADIGLTGLCTTDETGQCLVGEDNPGKFLVVAKHVDVDSRKTVYIGKFKNFRQHDFGSWWNWYQNDADADDSAPPTKITKNLRFTKLILKDGHVKFLGMYMTVVSGP